ncbi:hypothetical protein HOA55_03915 [archaeon]|jgi:parallel beta-helix repeat protein|nr:hypothetical protein [archaeon]MBT3577504.1 hypothetical protein [archaeon]MBT6820474.1 hypothetical protein [archaeon]MBT7025724.1 hypothetical protein [archaeon]MBT7239007.1 hypothetical protein [archaeon]
MEFFKRPIGKKAISATIAVILMILIVVAGIGILWGVLLPLIRDNTEFSGYDIDLVIETGGGYTYYDADKEVACVQVKRGGDVYNLSRIDIFFGFNGTSHISNFSGVEIPDPNEAKTKCFNLEGYGGAPESIRVSPVIWDGNREVMGEVSSETRSVSEGFYPDDQAPAASLEKPRKGNGGGKPAAECSNNLDCGTPSSVNICEGNIINITNTIPTCTGGVCGDIIDRSYDDCGDGGTCVVDTCVYDNPISECPYNLDQGGQTYNLINDLYSTSSCLIVSADDITIDFNGFNITGNDPRGGTISGVYVNGYGGVTIKNGKIYDFRFGVYLRENQNNNLLNLTSSSNGGGGVYFYSSSNNQLMNLTLNSNGYNGAAFYSSSNNNQLNNIFTNASKGNIGIFFSSSSNNTLTNITAITWIHSGIYLYQSSNNTLTDIMARAESGIGIYVSSSSNNVLDNVLVTSNGDQGVWISSSSNNTLSNIISNLNARDGIIISSSSNNTLFNTSTNSNGRNGLYFSGSSNDNTIDNATSCGNDLWDFYCSSSNRNSGQGNVFSGVNITNCVDIWPVQGIGPEGDYVACP